NAAQFHVSTGFHHRRPQRMQHRPFGRSGHGRRGVKPEAYRFTAIAPFRKLPEGRFSFPEVFAGRHGEVAMQPAVELDRVSKSFRVRRAPRPGVSARVRDLLRPQTRAVMAVDRLSFAIAPGERVAFIGPNGAGKSTTLKVL